MNFNWANYYCYRRLWRARYRHVDGQRTTGFHRTSGGLDVAARGRSAAAVKGCDHRHFAASARLVRASVVRQEERALRPRARPAADAPRADTGRCSRATRAGRSRQHRAGAHAPQAQPRLRRREPRRAVLRRGRGAGADHRGSQPRGARSCARTVRGHRREGQPPAGAAPGQLRRPQVRAARHQTSRHADPALRAGAGGRHRGQPRRRKLASSGCWSTSSATTCRCTANTSACSMRDSRSAGPG